MYFCGCGDLAQRVLGIEFGIEHGGWEAAHDAHGVEAPSFALPGDRPRYAPDRPVDVRHMDLAIALDFDEQRIRGDVTTHFTVLFDEVGEVVLDATELAIEEITLAGTKARLVHWMEGEKLHIRLDRPYTYGEELAVRVRYTARPRTGLVFVAPTEGDPDLPIQAWTQGETEYHHHWIPCHDFPNDRATTALRATVPGGFFALSNGRLEGVAEHADGTKTYAWRMEVPFPAYLVTLVAGEFAEIPNAWRDVPVNAYVPKGREEDGRRMFGKTPAMMEYYSERFGVAYPYPKYAQVVAHLFTGAMENASATTHTYRLLADARASLDYSPEPVVAHELVHQWHGDLLAVRDWAHTWLKEGFADYFEATWREHDLGVDEFRVAMREYLHNYLEADARGRRPIVYNVYRKNGNELFDRHVYDKAAVVLHALRFVLGEEAFWRAIQHYTRRNQGREVITADLERAVEEATGRSMGHFFEQWLYKAGHPEFNVSYSWDDERGMARLTVRQTQRVTETTPLFATPVDIAFLVPEAAGAQPDDSNAETEPVLFRVQVDEAEQTFYLPLARRPFAVRFDPGGWIPKTLEFERPAELLHYQLRHDADVLGRIEAAEALGKLADEESLAALERALLDESFWAVRAAIARALGARKTARALDALLAALEKIEEPKARRGIVAALGEFRAPEQAALAARAARALGALLATGEPSYYVEAAAATALGKTRASGVYEQLLPLLEQPSWNEILRTGAFVGLGELGEPRVVDVLAGWVVDRAKPMDARLGAVGGLRALAATKCLEGEAKTRAVDALLVALGDPWELTMMAAIGALRAWGDPRAIPALQRVVAGCPDERPVRLAREAILALRRGETATDEARRLRGDLDALQEENRQLQQRLEALEALVADGRPDGAPGQARRNGRAKASAGKEKAGAAQSARTKRA